MAKTKNDFLGDYTEKVKKVLEQAVNQCYADQAFVTQYNRLTGAHLRTKKAPLSLMIDQVTGKEAQELRDFVEFTAEYILRELLKGE